LLRRQQGIAGIEVRWKLPPHTRRISTLIGKAVTQDGSFKGCRNSLSGCLKALCTIH